MQPPPKPSGTSVGGPNGASTGAVVPPPPPPPPSRSSGQDPQSTKQDSDRSNQGPQSTKQDSDRSNQGPQSTKQDSGRPNQDPQSTKQDSSSSNTSSQSTTGGEEKKEKGPSATASFVGSLLSYLPKDIMEKVVTSDVGKKIAEKFNQMPGADKLLEKVAPISNKAQEIVGKVAEKLPDQETVIQTTQEVAEKTKDTTVKTFNYSLWGISDVLGAVESLTNRFSDKAKGKK